MLKRKKNILTAERKKRTRNKYDPVSKPATKMPLTANRVKRMYNRIPDISQYTKYEGAHKMLQRNLYSILHSIRYGIDGKSSLETYLRLVECMDNAPTPAELAEACINSHVGGPLVWPRSIKTYRSKTEAGKKAKAAMLKSWPETCILFSDMYSDEYVMHAITLYVTAVRNGNDRVARRARKWLQN